MTKQAGWYRELTREFEKDPEYWVEYLKLAFSEDVGRLMDEQGLNKADLARKLDSSRAYVTRLFRGSFNPTIETLVKVALALDARVALHLHPRQTDAHWLDVQQVVETRNAEMWADAKSLTVMRMSPGVSNATASSSAA